MAIELFKADEQPTMSAFNERLNQIISLFSDVEESSKEYADTKARISTGNYVGTGTYGEQSPNSIAVDFKPKLVGIMLANSDKLLSAITWLIDNGVGALFPLERATIPGWGISVDAVANVVTFNEKTIVWYSTQHAKAQLNEKSAHYYWIAIG